MAEQITKLSPHRDLQCYFYMPSAIAALSQASANGFTLSGKWRQQFDWAVVEWNRDNVFEHPSLRYLPDADLSGIKLSYQEQRTGCIPIESNLYADVAWNKIRVWVPNGTGDDDIYYIDVAMYATPNGSPTPASATMTLATAPPSGGWIGLAWLAEHYIYQPASGQSLSEMVAGLASIINDPNIGSPSFGAAASGNSITVTWNPKPSSDQAVQNGTSYPNLYGANCNMTGMYGYGNGGAQVWQEPSAAFTGGQFPGTDGAPGSYTISLDFSNVQGTTDPNVDPKNPANAAQVITVPMNNVRKLRWTWAPTLQPAAQLVANSGGFQQAEFQVIISNWTVSGSNLTYSVAGPGSRRIEDTDQTVTYTGPWIQTTGNYSGSKIHYTQVPDATSSASCSITYTETATHQLFLGTQLFTGVDSSGGPTQGATITPNVNGAALPSINTTLNAEQVLARVLLGTYSAGSYTVTFTQNNLKPGDQFWFDFLEIVYPSTNLPDFSPNSELALATDWDTYHSQSLPAERTAWLINKLGFLGRVNHYTGALWFYELVRTGTQYASTTVQVSLAAEPNPPNNLAEIMIGETALDHTVLPDDTSDTLTTAFALLINNGSNSVWATANGTTLTVIARAMGTDGNGISIGLGPANGRLQITPSSATTAGGVDGAPYTLNASDPQFGNLNQTLMDTAAFWRVDLQATPRINRAARDWHLAYFTALQGYGMDVVASFSTELMNGDPSVLAGIAQCYPDGTPVIVSTPAVQTNFSPTSLAFWTQVYLDMAGLQSQAQLTPYLQSGEVQWWYFPKIGVGMTFYDAYTTQQFQATYGVPMQVIPSNDVDPTPYPNEMMFLPAQIGNYTASIRAALKAQYPNCRYEVLYPTDTNYYPSGTTSDPGLINQIVNYPLTDWTPANLTCLKTESFTFTGNHNLDLATFSMNFSYVKGFTNGQRSHLVGISDAWTAWMKEVDLAQSQALESIVLFALDQYCLVGYPPPPFVKLIRSERQA